MRARDICEGMTWLAIASLVLGYLVAQATGTI